MKMSITRAADILLRGGVIAYPTEGVFGLGCMPDNTDALDRLLTIKQRDSSKGLILLAAGAAQLDHWIRLSEALQIPEPDPNCPITWIVPAASGITEAVRGKHAGIAVRITTNPTAAAICNAVESAITSTSANLSGEAATRNPGTLRREFGGLVDYIVPGDCGPANGPSEIRDLITGHTIRPREV
jgi:L-threonylcarbamoyladenylate synthase